MAQASAFGFSGWDPIGTFGDAAIGGWLGGYFGNKADKKSAKRQLANQISYSTWSAQNLPSLQVEGLRKAGLNPILAVNSLGAAGGGSVGSGGNAFVGLPVSHSASGFDREAFEEAKRARRMSEATVREQESISDKEERENRIQRSNEDVMSDAFRRQMDADISSAEAEERASINQTIDESARHEALVGEGDRVYSNGKEIFNRDGSDYKDLVEMYKRKIEDASWSASGWKRAIDTAGSVVDLVTGARNALRKDVGSGVNPGKKESGKNKSVKNNPAKNKSSKNKSGRRRLKAFDDALGVKIYE